jgi:SAM-dependent methyltransferase
MTELDALLDDVMSREALNRAVLSRPRRRDGMPTRVIVEPVQLRDGLVYRFTRHLPDRTESDNVPPDAARLRLAELLADYRQGLLQGTEADWQVLGGTVLRRPATRPVADRGHDRRKRRLLEEGRPVPFLVELGVMTPDGQVRKSRYAKFRQVSRFLELVEDVVPALPAAGALRIVDFGCGKSYLTFALHHLLTELHGREVDIVGLDRNEDVVSACSALAGRSGSEGLRFETGDIAGYRAEGPVDLVVSLHACDTASDDALAQAIRWEARVILAVPCCHMEAARQISSDALAPLLRHGLAKERFAALVTDTLRAQLLELEGYRTQLVEFVDLEHTAKNVLIRATRGRPAGATARASYEALRDSLGLEPKLERLLSRA